MLTGVELVIANGEEEGREFSEAFSWSIIWKLAMVSSWCPKRHTVVATDQG